jgi:hypothetical protein
MTKARGDFLEHPLARRVFQQANQRLDFRIQSHQLRVEFRLRSADGLKLCQQPAVAQAR